MKSLSIERREGGRLAELRLSAGKGNVLDRAAISELSKAFAELGADRELRAILLTAQGSNFSFGASVPEHVPGEVETMLPAFHQLFRDIAKSALPVVAVVQGRCLGGGLELALAAHRIEVSADAKLGVPEVTLGVFPPVASAVLPLRVSQPVVDRLVTLGEIVDAQEALRIGLVDGVSATPAEARTQALSWAHRYLELSAVAVRYATRAARAAWDDALHDRLERLERLYLDELMGTHDAKEGIAAFLERREPDWTNA